MKTIGPTVPSKYLDSWVEGDNDHGLSLWKKESIICENWLESKEAGSVVYATFESLVVSEEQI